MIEVVETTVIDGIFDLLNSDKQWWHQRSNFDPWEYSFSTHIYNNDILWITYDYFKMIRMQCELWMDPIWFLSLRAKMILA